MTVLGVGYLDRIPPGAERWFSAASTYNDVVFLFLGLVPTWVDVADI